jgi:hypothetical protein
LIVTTNVDKEKKSNENTNTTNQTTTTPKQQKQTLGDQNMGIASRAIRNLARRKIRALLVIIALSFSMAIMIAIPAGTMANQKAAEDLTSGLGETIAQTEAAINKTMTQIDVSLTPSIFMGGANGMSTSVTITAVGDSGSTKSGPVFGGGSYGDGSMPMKPTATNS